jgi:hypothetical protein
MPLNLPNFQRNATQTFHPNIITQKRAHIIRLSRIINLSIKHFPCIQIGKINLKLFV